MDVGEIKQRIEELTPNSATVHFCGVCTKNLGDQNQEAMGESPIDSEPICAINRALAQAMLPERYELTMQLFELWKNVAIERCGSTGAETIFGDNLQVRKDRVIRFEIARQGTNRTIVMWYHRETGNSWTYTPLLTVHGPQAAVHEYYEGMMKIFPLTESK